ncbi:hypothetical protein [Agromyces sp. NPDC058064]|uniref:hypothetical protein n=1 Tax=Agromyces sp. NPDC058064 TaxID=3346322 RepID=UPI0036D9998F
MSMTKRQRELEAQNRVAVGLPENRCPACGQIGRHWIADALDEHEVIVPGRYACSPSAAGAVSAALDGLEVDA